MQILLNGDNEITSYATIGGFENGIEIEKYPDTFTEMFEPRMFKYIDGAIVKNDNFNKSDDSIQTNKSYEERINTLEKEVSELKDLLNNQPQA
ncbi:DUF2977 domain-containing protein [Staphylococcus saprophyticus]|uniref:DUF2977 domain-containing protein n=1 Tax=Staphylococcus saprophyticus TaxID=29385 RepID=UPI0008538784|nr:DUF2977 domain-containing protein [Staphylococcus saprophyticus]MDW4367114.1 DUF2977 domain-containing protein [Staphylococcus saprophyticus]OEK94354.1 hypothetical protein AST08_09935 [Staphylococcus saprophyticus]SUM89488.1 phage protein [Staphylococcus saprophyticus]